MDVNMAFEITLTSPPTDARRGNEINAKNPFEFSSMYPATSVSTGITNDVRTVLELIETYPPTCLSKGMDIADSFVFKYMLKFPVTYTRACKGSAVMNVDVIVKFPVMQVTLVCVNTLASTLTEDTHGTGVVVLIKVVEVDVVV